MSQRKDKWIVGLALFSMFFGAGNVIFPPYLGMTAASMWVPAFICYYIADIGLAMLAILAMLKCDSDIEGITCRIGRIPAVLLSTLVVLCVGPMLAIPRTAATTWWSGCASSPPTPTRRTSGAFWAGCSSPGTTCISP